MRSMIIYLNNAKIFFFFFNPPKVNVVIKIIIKSSDIHSIVIHSQVNNDFNSYSNFEMIKRKTKKKSSSSLIFYLRKRRKIRSARWERGRKADHVGTLWDSFIDSVIFWAKILGFPGTRWAASSQKAIANWVQRTFRNLVLLFSQNLFSKHGCSFLLSKMETRDLLALRMEEESIFYPFSVLESRVNSKKLESKIPCCWRCSYMTICCTYKKSVAEYPTLCLNKNL